MAKFVCGRVENIVGKGENAGYHHFPTMTPKLFLYGSSKIGIVWERVNASVQSDLALGFSPLYH